MPVIKGLKKISPKEKVTDIRHGTTVGTNTIIERKGGKTALLTTKGFRDLLEIGRQKRPELYNLRGRKPEVLISRDLRFEVRERIDATGSIKKKLKEKDVLSIIEKIKNQNIQSVAILFLHSYINNLHEKRTAEIIKKELPAAYLAISSDLIPEFREYERLTTTALNAYLGPILINYLSKLISNIKKIIKGVPIYLSQSDGGISSPENITSFPVRTAYSGPSAGVVGAAGLAKQKQLSNNVISLDIGGTSTDISLINNFSPVKTVEKEILGFPIKFPTIDLLTIGSGGGSIAAISHGHLKVGPESAGADPGPACYGKGGTEPTVTDANLILGIIGKNTMLGHKIGLDKEKAEKAINNKIAEIFGWSLQESAWAIIKIMVDNISNTIHKLILSKGINPGNLNMVAYGGAGPMHAADICRELGISKAIIPSNPGVFSAMGLFSCDLTMDFVKTVRGYDKAELVEEINSLKEKGIRWFEKEAVKRTRQKLCFSVDMRYKGQNYEINIPLVNLNLEKNEIWENILKNFNEKHYKVYGHYKDGMPIEVINIRLKCIGKSKQRIKKIFKGKNRNEIKGYRKVKFLNSKRIIKTPVIDKNNIGIKEKITGPLIIEQLDSTIVIPLGDEAVLDKYGDLVINILDH